MLFRCTTKLLLPALCLGVLLVSRPAHAHHSAAAQFDATKPITLVGSVTRMLWSNPHAWLYIDVKGPDGKVVNWACENSSLNQLIRTGWKKTDLPVGVVVTVHGIVARDGTPTVSVDSVTLPDGRKLFGGSPTDAAPGTAVGAPAAKE